MSQEKVLPVHNILLNLIKTNKIMQTIYWITRLDYIQSIFIISTLLSGAAFILSAIISYIAANTSSDDESRRFKKFTKTSLVVFLVSLCTATFIPSTKEACFIYVGGNTLEYIQKNDKVKELPDKVVELANQYIDDMLKEKGAPEDGK